MKLQIHSWGGGDRRVLLLHGVASAAAGWWRVGGDLAARGWSVIAPDLRGHGASPMAPSYSFADHAADALELGSDWDAVVGHSLGGAVAVIAAAGEPAWTRRLVLQDPALLVATDTDDVLSWLMTDFAGPMTAEWVQEHNPRYHPEDARLKALALRQTMPEIVEQTVHDNMPWNILGEAETLAVPTVIIGSDPRSGGIVPITIGEWLASSNPMITYRMLEGAGHSAHRERDSYESYVVALLEALEGETHKESA